MKRLLLALVLVASQAASQTVTITGDGAAQVVSVGIPGPAGPAWSGGAITSTVSLSTTAVDGYASIFELKNPLDPTHGGYYFLADWSPYFNSTRDPVAFIGYNVSTQGTPRLAGEPVISVGFEGDYESVPGTHLVEWYTQYVGTDWTTVRRPFGLSINRATHYTDASWEADIFTWWNGGRTVQSFSMTMADQTFHVLSGAIIRKSTNNQGFIYQNSSGGSGISLLYLDNNNVTQISTSGNPVALRDDELRLTASVFTGLNASAPNGTLTYCSDCAKATPCAGSGTGALAKRLNGAWDCN